MRHDALDTYWQQTQHSELGLASLLDNRAGAGGIAFSRMVGDALALKDEGWAELNGRMTQATNILLGGKPAATPAAGPSSSPGAVSVQSGAPAHKAGPLKPVPQPTMLAPLSADGRIVLTPQDRVLLIGDSMMQGVGPHVARALQNAHVSTIDVSRQSTGLTYPAYFDWPGMVQKTIPNEKITVLVAFLGANDTWDMILDGRYERFGSDRWKTVYAARIDRIVHYAQSQRVRLIWLGVPNMGRAKINSGAKVLNGLLLASMQGATARYVSTRDILGNDADVFQKYITRPDGKRVVVRTDDGIHFTRDGQKLLSDLILRQFVLPSDNKTS
jgi:hypothetical protein